MTKRTSKPKATPTISQNATKQPVEKIKQESNTKVAPKAKASTNASQKTSTGRRGRPKKALVEKVGDDLVYTENGKQLLDESLTIVNKVIDVDSRTITYASAGNAVPSKYEQFKAWLVSKLYHYTSYFKGY